MLAIVTLTQTSASVNLFLEILQIRLVFLTIWGLCRCLLGRWKPYFRIFKFFHYCPQKIIIRYQLMKLLTLKFPKEFDKPSFLVLIIFHSILIIPCFYVFHSLSLNLSCAVITKLLVNRNCIYSYLSTLEYLAEYFEHKRCFINVS